MICFCLFLFKYHVHVQTKSPSQHQPLIKSSKPPKCHYRALVPEIVCNTIHSVAPCSQRDRQLQYEDVGFAGRHSQLEKTSHAGKFRQCLFCMTNWYFKVLRIIGSTRRYTLPVARDNNPHPHVHHVHHMPTCLKLHWGRLLHHHSPDIVRRIPAMPFRSLPCL